ncbi:MAG: FtsX-like permease family protein [Anaerolineales bacterium]|nr:FtsX-like permease family protein [Anaerolineales bacterium]
MKSEVKPNFLKPRWSKVFSDLWDDKTRTALVVVSIAAGVFAVGMIITAFVVLSEDINSSYAAANPVNIEIRADPFHEDLVRVIEKVPGVDDVEGRQIIPIRARRGSGNWQGLSLVGIKDFENLAINQLGRIDGSQIPGRGEIIVSQDMMNDTGFQVGDEIEVELPDGSTHYLTVAGLVSDQTTARYDADITINVFATLDTVRSLGLGNFFNRLFITVEGDGSSGEFIAAVAADVEEKMESHQRVVYGTKENLSNEHPMTDILLAMMGVLGALGILITILSASLIINTLNAMMTQQLRQIGVMKLIGARSFQILGMYLSLIVVYGLIALVVAVPLGTIAGNSLARYITDMMGAGLLGFRIVPTAIIVQVVIAFLIPLVAGFFPVNKGAKTNVRRAISNYRPENQSAGRSILNLSGRWVSWISRPILLSFRNTFRKKGRLILTIFTLTIAGAVFIAVFNVRASMDNVMDQLMQHFLGDVTVNFSQPYNKNKVTRDLLAVPGVAGVEGWGGAGGEILDENGDVVTSLTIIAPPLETQLLDPDLVAGRLLMPGEKKAMVISDTIYNDYPDLQPGDTLMVEITGTREEAWEVVGIYRFVDMLGNPMAYANFDYVASKVNLQNQAYSFRLIIDYSEGGSIQTLIQRIDNYLEDRGYAVRSILDGNTMRENAGTGVNILVTFLLIMALLTAFVGSIGLMGTMSISVLERTREIGVMRTIGAVDSVVMQSVIIEGLVIGLITWFLAIGLSYPISSVLLKIIGQSIAGSTFELIFTPLGIFIWLAVVIVLSIIASIMPARNAARLTINEVLAYE